MRKVKVAFVAIALGALVVLAGCSSPGVPVASAELQAAKSEPIPRARPETSQEQAIKRYDIYKLKKQQQELARQERIAKQKEKEKKEAERRRRQSHGSHGSPPVILLGT